MQLSQIENGAVFIDISSKRSCSKTLRALYFTRSLVVKDTEYDDVTQKRQALYCPLLRHNTIQQDHPPRKELSFAGRKATSRRIIPSRSRSRSRSQSPLPLTPYTLILPNPTFFRTAFSTFLYDNKVYLYPGSLKSPTCVIFTSALPKSFSAKHTRISNHFPSQRYKMNGTTHYPPNSQTHPIPHPHKHKYSDYPPAPQVHTSSTPSSYPL